jgi:hypothetical protein
VLLLLVTSLLVYRLYDEGWYDALTEPQSYACDDFAHGFSQLQRRYEGQGDSCTTIQHAYTPGEHLTSYIPIGGQVSRDNVTSPVSIVLHMPVCGHHFSFAHYVSIKSAVQSLQPNELRLYTSRLYHRFPQNIEWLDKVYDLAIHVTVSVHEPLECSGRTASDMHEVIVAVAKRRPDAVNVFLQSDVMVRDSNLGNILSKRSRVSFDTIIIVSDQTALDTHSKLQSKPNVAFVSCPLLNNASVSLDALCNGCKRIGSCYRLSDDISPRDIVVDKSPLSALIRLVAYGNSDIICPAKYSRDVIPRVGHYSWFNRRHIDFSFYLSVLSLLHVAGVKCVVVHGNLPLAGPYWSDLQSRACVRWQYWPLADHVYGTPPHMYLAHRADITRGEIIARYGGLNVDPDVYFVNPLPAHIWSYETVLSLDAYPGSNEFFVDLPKSAGAFVNLGVCLSAPGSRYFRLYQATQRTYIERAWLYNSGVKPSEVYDLHPDLALLVPNLQVPCFKGKCEAGWVRNGQEFSEILQRQHCLLHNTYALHFTWPDPDVFEHPANLRANGTTLYDKVAAIIMSRAGVTIEQVHSLHALDSAA